MIKIVFVSGVALLAAGCATQGDPLTGSDMTTDAEGRSQFVTYVTMEEFQRMTPEERKRLNAAVGSSGSLFPSRKKPARRISEEDLDELYSKEK